LEDKIILEAQQESISRYPGAVMIDINDDAPCIAISKALRAAILAEQAEMSQSAAAE